MDWYNALTWDFSNFDSCTVVIKENTCVLRKFIVNYLVIRKSQPAPKSYCSSCDYLPGWKQTATLGLSAEPEYHHVPAPVWQVSKPGPKWDRAMQRPNMYSTDCTSYRLQRRTVWAKVVMESLLEDGQDVAKEGRKRKAFREKRDVGKGRRQNQVWQVQGLEKEQPMASC